MEQHLYEEIVEDPHTFYSWKITPEWIEEHFPEHRKYRPNDWTQANAVQISPPGHVYPIHDEASRKVISIVHYIGDVGDGTEIYDKDKNYVKTIEWKPNRAFVFAGLDGITWHAFKNPRDFPRVTIVSFFIRTGSRPD